MELRVIDKTDEELRIEIGGEDHTFMNVLKGELLQTDTVTAATYDVNPEQSGGQTDPVLSIKTEEGVDALEALEDGTDAVIEKAVNFTTRSKPPRTSNRVERDEHAFVRTNADVEANQSGVRSLDSVAPLEVAVDECGRQRRLILDWSSDWGVRS